MADPNWQLQKFIIGIRHERTFLISDIHGGIMDVVLGLRKKVLFPKGCFSQMTRPDVTKIILTDKDENLSLTCSIDGVVIQAEMFEGSLVAIEKVAEIFTHIVHAVLPLTEAKDKINRLGVIYEFQISNFTNSAKTIFSQFMKVNLTGIHDNMLMRISLKNPVTESVMSSKSHHFQTGLFGT